MQSIFGHFLVSEFFNSHSLLHSFDPAGGGFECNGLVTSTVCEEPHHYSE
jgi:hypothetical protein